MRIGVIGDVHGNAPALAAVMHRVKHEVDALWFLGDLVGYYGLVGACLDRLHDAPLIGVRGNHDQVLLDCLPSGSQPPAAYTAVYGTALARTLAESGNRAGRLLEPLPVTLRTEVDGICFVLCHGAPWAPTEGRVYPDFADWERFEEFGADVFILGHTHYQFKHDLGSFSVLNPGSVGQPRDMSGVAEYALIETEPLQVRLEWISYDVTAAEQDALEHNPTLAYLTEVLHR